MAKQTVEFTRAERYGVEGHLFQTADGTQLIFANDQEVRDFAEALDTSENALRFGLARLLHQEPNLTVNAQNKHPYLLNKAVDLESISASPVVIR